MGVLEFKGYFVKRMAYDRNEHFDPATKQIEIMPKINTSSRITDDNHIHVTLTVLVGSTDNKNIPFKVDCSIEGHFIYNADEDDNDFGLDAFIRTNCVAILYPYIRALISSLTNSSNEFSAFNLPTINVGETLKKSNQEKKSSDLSKEENI